MSSRLILIRESLYLARSEITLLEASPEGFEGYFRVKTRDGYTYFITPPQGSTPEREVKELAALINNSQPR